MNFDNNAFTRIGSVGAVVVTGQRYPGLIGLSQKRKMLRGPPRRGKV